MTGGSGLADTGAIALMLGMTPNAVRILACRHPEALPRRGRDRKGRTLYAVADAEQLRQERLAKTAVLTPGPPGAWTAAA